MKLDITNINQRYQIQDYDAYLEEFKEKVDTRYKVYEITSISDYRDLKDSRANLNKISKLLNDEKIRIENESIGILKSQIKSLCDILDSKSKEINQTIRTYEETALNKQPRKKAISTIEIKVYNEQERELLLRMINNFEYKEKKND